MKYFLDSKTAEKFSNPKDNNNKIFVLNGTCETIKSKLLQDICSNAEKQGLLLEKFFSPYDYDTLCAVYIKSSSCFICDSSYLSQTPKNAELIDTDSVFSIPIEIDEFKEYFRRRNNILSEVTKVKNSANFLFCENKKIMSKYVSKPKILNFILRFAARNKLHQSQEAGTSNIRMLSSITAWGVHSFYETVFEHHSNIITLCGANKNAASLLISGLNEMFCQCGYDTTLCKCSLTDSAEHLSIDKLSLAFVTDNDYHSLPYGEAGRIHIDRFLNSRIPESVRFQALINEEHADDYISKAVFSLYDALEVQNAISDTLFDRIDEEKQKNLCNKVISKVFANN